MVPNVCKSPRKKPSFLGGVWYILILGGMGWLFIFEDLESQTSLLPSQTHLVPQLLWEVRVPVKWLYHVVSLEPLHMGIILHSEQTFIHHKVVSHNHPGDIILPKSQPVYPMNPFQNGGFLWSVDEMTTFRWLINGDWGRFITLMVLCPHMSAPSRHYHWGLAHDACCTHQAENHLSDRPVGLEVFPFTDFCWEKWSRKHGWWGYTSNACSLPGKLAQIQTIVDYIIMVIENNPKCGP